MPDPISSCSNPIQPCHGCNKRSDWDFIKEFYHRERQLVDQIHHLNHQVAITTAALQHAGLSTQNDRIALNAASARLGDVERSYAELQVALARAENKSHEEGQELRQLQQAFNQNRLHAAELERNLDCVWKAHARMGEVIAHCAAQDGDLTPSVDVGKLMLELEAKTLRIQILEEETERTLQKHSEERENYTSALKQHQVQLIELQSAGPTHAAPPEQSSIRRRKRYRGHHRAVETGAADQTKSEPCSRNPTKALQE